MTVSAIEAANGSAKIDEFERLYRAWRYAKAQWDLAENDPARPGGLDEDEDSSLCEAEHKALIEFFMHPTFDLKQIALKLRVFRDTGGWEFGQASAIVERLSKDADRAAFGHPFG